MFKKYYQQVVEFLGEVRNELLRVAFPTRKETILTTTVVVMFVILLSVILSLMDAFLVNLVKMII